MSCLAFLIQTEANSSNQSVSSVIWVMM